MHCFAPRHLSAAIAFLAFSAHTFSASAEDLTIVFKMSEGGMATHYFTKSRIRMNSVRIDTIMEFASGRILTIDNEKAEYFETTVTEIDEALKAAAAKMEATTANLSPQMRDQMVKMLGGGGSEAVLTKGSVRTIAGYSCQTYVVMVGNSMTRESCNTTALTPPFDPADLRALSRVGVPVMPGIEKLIQKTAEIPGIALMQHTTMMMMGQKAETRLVASEVRQGPVAAEVFAIPEGYSQVPSPLAAPAKTRR